jgi:hypothetical protein
MSRIDRHRSANVPDFEWTCPLTATGRRSAHSTCAKAFAKEMGFQLIETSDDGNCFFYTLAKFAKRSGFAPLLLAANERENAAALRSRLVDHIQENIHVYQEFMYNNENGGNSVNNQIRRLRRNGEWASDIGDLVPIAGANAFGIHINMYNIQDEGDRDVIRLIPIRSEQPTEVYVSIMRVREGHFQLLWPLSDSLDRSHSGSQMVPQESLEEKEKEVLQAAKTVVKAAKTVVQAAQAAVSSHSLQNQEQELNHMIKNLNQLSIGAPRPRRSSRLAKTAKQVSPRRNLSASSVRKSSRTRKNKSLASSSSYSPASSYPSAPRYNSYENSNNELRRAIEASLQNRL